MTHEEQNQSNTEESEMSKSNQFGSLHATLYEELRKYVFANHEHIAKTIHDATGYYLKS